MYLLRRSERYGNAYKIREYLGSSDNSRRDAFAIDCYERFENSEIVLFYNTSIYFYGHLGFKSVGIRYFAYFIPTILNCLV